MTLSDYELQFHVSRAISAVAELLVSLLGENCRVVLQEMTTGE